MTSGTKIRLLREQKNWDQIYLAEKIGISQPALSKIESDQTKLSWEHAIKLSIIFEVDPEYFFDSNINNYISNNQKVNQLYNSEYKDNDIELIKNLYEEQIKAKDALLHERFERIEELKLQIKDLKNQIINSK